MSTVELRTHGLRPVIQTAGLARKELADMLRQPRLLLVLIVGPFLILLLFAAGYDQQSVVLRTVFVAPEGSVYEDEVGSYSEEIEAYVETVGFTSDEAAARDLVADDEADLMVVFPPDPVETILGGEQAEIRVVHDKIDPLQQTAVRVSAQVAVNELNSAVLQRIVQETQAAMSPVTASLDEIEAIVGTLGDRASSADASQVGELTGELRGALEGIEATTRVSYQVVSALADETDPDQQERLATFRGALDDTRDAIADLESVEDGEGLDEAITAVAGRTEEIVAMSDDILTLDPAVAIQPFTTTTENLLPDPVAADDFFAPSAISLLLAHLGVTFAALAIVRDEQRGLLEVYRVAPVGGRHVLVGKYVAYMLTGAVVACALLAAIVLGLDVPLRGSTGMVAVVVALLLLASIGLGFVLSALARTDTQAVQYAMLVLLAGLFFGGFFLSLDLFSYPVKLISWMLPVTYAINALQDLMLRGTDPAVTDLAGLGATSVAYGALAALLFSRRLRVR